MKHQHTGYKHNILSTSPPHNHHTTTSPPCFATTKYMHTMHLHGVHFTDNRKTRLQDAPSAGFTLQCTEVKLFCSANQFIVLHHHQALLGRVACVLASSPRSLFRSFFLIVNIVVVVWKFTLTFQAQSDLVSLLNTFVLYQYFGICEAKRGR